MSKTKAMSVSEQLGAIASTMQAVAHKKNRDDLAARLDSVTDKLADKSVKAVVVGQFKQGKSALVNALVSAPVCPVDDVIATAVPTVVKWGVEPHAALVTKIDGSKDKAIHTEVDPRRLRRHVTDLAGESGFLGHLHAEVELPRRLLAEGVVLVDTPGVGRGHSRAATNLTLLPQADVAIMVSDVTQELTDPELNFLKQASALCPRVACVVSKNDLQHHWRSIVAANQEHLTTAGIDAPVIATSALLHSISDQEQDPQLRKESRVDELAKYLLRDVRSEVIAGRHRAVVDDVCSLAEHLAMAVEAELQTLETSDNGQSVVDSFESAKRRADLLMKRSSRWQQTLSDGFGELISDTEFDLRDRLREVGREAEQLIDESDPGRSWEEIGAWLAESLTQAISDNFVWAHKRSVHLAEVVAEHFSLDGHATVPDLPVTGAEKMIGLIGGLEAVKSGRMSVMQKLMVGMKGSYGGVLMFGLMTTLAGMALVNPISIAAGLVMGGFAYKQDMSHRLEQRRAEAKNAVRRLIDEAIFKISKESRDRTTRVKRVLRDHFIALAEDLKVSLNESVRRAKEGAAVPSAQRDSRFEQLTNELNEIKQLSQRARQLVEVATVVRLERRSA